ncbi:MAG: DUF2179 domain-containing protein, partial [Spirochaetota bacterium]
ILLGFGIFFARIIDVSLGTIRTIAIVHGRIFSAFMLGVVEISVWVLVVSEVIPKIRKHPELVFFYAIGFATGSVIGILVEQKIAIGDVIIRFISPRAGEKIAKSLRQSGFPVTIFRGEGMKGPVNLLYMVCKRKYMNRAIAIAQEHEPEIFYATETPGKVRETRRKKRFITTGWRSIIKGK